MLERAEAILDRLRSQLVGDESIWCDNGCGQCYASANRHAGRITATLRGNVASVASLRHLALASPNRISVACEFLILSLCACAGEAAAVRRLCF
jgi:hypothetical protein